MKRISHHHSTETACFHTFHVTGRCFSQWWHYLNILYVYTVLFIYLGVHVQAAYSFIYKPGLLRKMHIYLHSKQTFTHHIVRMIQIIGNVFSYTWRDKSVIALKVVLHN